MIEILWPCSNSCMANCNKFSNWTLFLLGTYLGLLAHNPWPDPPPVFNYIYKYFIKLLTNYSHWLLFSVSYKYLDHIYFRYWFSLEHKGEEIWYK